MSVRLMTLVFSEAVQPAAKKLLLLALADYAADDGSSIFPSVDTMAGKVSLKRRQVYRMLRDFQRDGWLEQVAPSERHRPAVYRLSVPPRGVSPETQGVSPKTQATDQGCPTRHTRGVVEDTGGVSPETPNPSEDIRQGDPSEETRTPARVNTGFTAFWNAYPRRTHRRAAEKAWTALAPDAALLARILMALEWQAQSPDWIREGRRFVPHPASYLNGARWEDERPDPTLVSARTAENAANLEVFMNRGRKR